MSVINNNVTFKEFRNRCEDKNTLANAGDIYVGTGVKSSEVSNVSTTVGKNIQTAIAEDIGRLDRVELSNFSAGNTSGNGAVSIGVNARGGGALAVAIGTISNASAVHSTALGYDAIANASQAVSIGRTSRAINERAASLGFYANASGISAIAIGDTAKAYGESTIVIGRNSSSGGGINQGNGAIAIGNAANAYHSYSIAIGEGSLTGDPYESAISIGNGANSSGDFAISIGNGANALLESVAIGDMAYAELGGAVAVGTKVKVSRGSSVGIGLGADVFGSRSIAIGYNSSATSDASIAIGTNASLRGDSSIAIGHAAKTGNPLVSELRAVNSIAIGYNASADFTGGIAIGPNAFAGWGNYSVAIGYNASAKAPQGSDAKGRTAIGVGANASERAIVIAGNDVVMYVADSGSAWAHDSDERIKEKIELGNTSLCLKNINDVPVKRYAYKNFADKYADKHQLGFIAQDLEKVYPKLVFTNDVREFDNPDNPSEKIKIENFKSIEREPLIPVLWGGVQELSKIINEMQNRISELEKEISEIKA